MVSTTAVNTTTPATSNTSKTNSSSSNAGVATSSDAADASASIGQTYNEFLTLLTTQLQNQDPLSPMDSAQFTQQLVMFSQVEQQINTNSKLEQILQQDQTNQTLQAASFLGKSVAAEGDVQPYTGSGSVNIGYDFTTAPTGSIVIQIYNANGSTLERSVTVGSPTAGVTAYTWDGKDDNGNQLPAGDYKFTVQGVSAAGTSTAANSTFITGTVNNISTVSGTTDLIVGDISVPLSSIMSVSS